MKALVFGQTGQVARELARTVPERVEAQFLGRDSVDLLEPEACAQAIHAARPDVVINAAAYTAVDRAEEEEPAALVINAHAPGAMARAAADLGVAFLHISTDYVFDGSGSAPWAPDDLTGPLGAYGRTKLAGEVAVRAAGGQHAILRTSWVVSEHGANFVKTMLRLAQSRDALTIVADQVGGPTPAADIARALWTMAAQMHSAPTLGGTYHFAGTPDVSWADFARAIFDMADQSVTVTDIPSTDYPTSAARPANSRLDCAGLETDFTIPRPEWQHGVAQILKALKEDGQR